MNIEYKEVSILPFYKNPSGHLEPADTQLGASEIRNYYFFLIYGLWWKPSVKGLCESCKTSPPPINASLLRQTTNGLITSLFANRVDNICHFSEVPRYR